MQQNLKIGTIGGGSSYKPELVCFDRREALADAHFVTTQVRDGLPCTEGR